MTRTNPPSVVVHGDAVRVDHLHDDLPTAEARHRYGGADALAALSGALAALGTTTVLAALAAAAVRAADQPLDGGRAVVAGLVCVALGALTGGWVAGRCSRYDGMRNGLLAGLLLALLTAAVVAVGLSADEAVTRAHLPAWLSGTDRELLVGAATAVLALVLGALGGTIGGRWHRRVDELLLGTRAGGLAPYPGDLR